MIGTSVKLKTCLCGCGSLVRLNNLFIKGHNRRGINTFNSGIYSPRLCLCGCGKITKKLRGRFNRYIKGHENIGRSAWNKGKSFSEASKLKMRQSHLGKEPANKIPIDLDVLHKLYIRDRKNIAFVSKAIGVPADAIKNRLRSLGWSRTTKESCSSEEFKERMRQIRVDFLASDKKIETPNKLERLVYDSIEELNIPYEKQVPLFGKFVVDTLFPDKNLVLEVFGQYWHERPTIIKKDYSKRKYLEKCGYKVEEIWDYEIKRQGIQTVLKNVFQKHGLL
jgi:very-short-patch-repair endonuclease